MDPRLSMVSNESDAVKTRVMVADDHQLLRDAMSAPLKQVGFDVQMADSFETTCDLIETAGYFDIVLLDVDMPGMDGLNSIKTILTHNAPGAVVLFSGSVSPILVKRALDEGAKGFIPKSVSLKSLENALRLVETGEMFVPYGFLESSGNGTSAKPADGRAVKLTERELEVLYGVANGQSNKEIAFELGFTEVTIKMHMRSICSKLGAKNRTQASMIAKQRQII